MEILWIIIQRLSGTKSHFNVDGNLLQSRLEVTLNGSNPFS